MQRPLQNIAYLTAELTARDLDSRILIAAHLLKLGIPSLVGAQWGMWTSRDVLPAGCFLFKTANRVQGREMANCCLHNHLVIAMDEEALPQAGDIMLDSIDASAIEHCHLFLAQNEAHKAIIAARFPDARSRIHVVGNPRMDVLHVLKDEFMAEARGIRAEIGPFFLFNTGCALTNSVWGDVASARRKLLLAVDIPDRAAAERFMDARLQAETAGRSEMDILIQKCLEEFPTHRVVIRPHPAERADTWRLLASDRVTIAANTPAPPWMLAADGMVHCDSTTGLEAAVLGVRCVNISPVADWRRNFVMHDVNDTVATAVEALGSLQSNRAPTTRAAVHTFFPHDAAKQVAKRIALSLKKHGARAADLNLQWASPDRDPRIREKFHVPPDQFAARLKLISSKLGISKYGVFPVDESIFLTVPQ